MEGRLEGCRNPAGGICREKKKSIKFLFSTEEEMNMNVI